MRGVIIRIAQEVPEGEEPTYVIWSKIGGEPVAMGGRAYLTALMQDEGESEEQWADARWTRADEQGTSDMLNTGSYDSEHIICGGWGLLPRADLEAYADLDIDGKGEEARALLKPHEDI